MTAVKGIYIICPWPQSQNSRNQLFVRIYAKFCVTYTTLVVIYAKSCVTPVKFLSISHIVVYLKK
jgi:hypothetical protein